MNSESLGKRFKNRNQEYECIAYTDNPTITMKNLETGEKINMVVGSMLANEFEEIIEEDNNKIEKIDHLYILQTSEFTDTDVLQDINNKNIRDKINEIIDKINNMEKIWQVK